MFLTLTVSFFFLYLSRVWKACSGLDKEAAEAAYLELVEEVSPGWSQS